MFLFNYRGRSMDRNITNEPFAYLTVGFRQQFLAKRLSAQVNIMDIFNSYRNYYRQDSGSVVQLWQNRFETRIAKLNLSYSFGGPVKNAKKSGGADEEKSRGRLQEN